MQKYDFSRLVTLGVSLDDAAKLRRISMTLHRWHELECGDSNDYASWCVVRGKKTGKLFEYEDSGKPYMERHAHTANPRVVGRGGGGARSGAPRQLSSLKLHVGGRAGQSPPSPSRTGIRNHRYGVRQGGQTPPWRARASCSNGALAK